MLQPIKNSGLKESHKCSFLVRFTNRKKQEDPGEPAILFPRGLSFSEQQGHNSSLGSICLFSLTLLTPQLPNPSRGGNGESTNEVRQTSGGWKHQTDLCKYPLLDLKGLKLGRQLLRVKALNNNVTHQEQRHVQEWPLTGLACQQISPWETLSEGMEIWKLSYTLGKMILEHSWQHESKPWETRIHLDPDVFSRTLSSQSTRLIFKVQ